MSITKTAFGTTTDGKTADLYRLQNASGASVTVTSFGARIVSICVPDRDGSLRDVTLGYDTLAGYEADRAHFGGVVGRVANRIGKGEFTLDGVTYQLAVNNGPNHLHGGKKGFHFYVWDAAVNDDTLRFTRVSPDGEEGYPGTLTMTVDYTWSEDNALHIVYRAETDQKTLFATTNHAYFNLSGEDADTVLDHLLTIHADRFTESDEHILVTGKILDVAGTPLDFRTAKPIGQDIHADYCQMTAAKGYDHNFVLNPPEGDATESTGSDCGKALREAAVLDSPVSGIRMTCLTDQPGIQFYVPPMSPAACGKGGRRYPPYGSCCLETQHFPDAIHQPHFPSIVLNPEDTFCSETVYRFSVES